MESIYSKLALYGIENECARTDNVIFPISEICDGMVSLKQDKFWAEFRTWLVFNLWHLLGRFTPTTCCWCETPYSGSAMDSKTNLNPKFISPIHSLINLVYKTSESICFWIYVMKTEQKLIFSKNIGWRLYLDGCKVMFPGFLQSLGSLKVHRSLAHGLFQFCPTQGWLKKEGSHW